MKLSPRWDRYRYFVACAIGSYIDARILTALNLAQKKTGRLEEHVEERQLLTKADNFEQYIKSELATLHSSVKRIRYACACVLTLRVPIVLGAQRRYEGGPRTSLVQFSTCWLRRKQHG